jgi:hypothetical protein
LNLIVTAGADGVLARRAGRLFHY